MVNSKMSVVLYNNKTAEIYFPVCNPEWKQKKSLITFYNGPV